MTSALAFPPARRLEGSLRVPPSKSATNRAFVLAALSESPVTVVRPLDAGDTRSLLRCLAGMGARIEDVAEGVRISGPLRGGPGITGLDAKDSGTAARFLLSLACATSGEFLLTGSPRLSDRPFGELVAALRSLGGDISEEGLPGRLPLRIRGGGLRGGRVRVDASRSSQFLSALMLLGAAGPSVEVEAAGAVASKPYASMTAAALRDFGHRVEGDGDGPWRVSRGAAAPPARYETAGDFSSAIPLIAAVGAAGGEIRLAGVTLSAADADALAVPVLREMGIEIEGDSDGIVAGARPGAVRPVAASAADFPDAVPSLAALAAFAAGESRFEGIAHLRWKESDRLAALEAVVSRAGAQASVLPESLVIRGPLRSEELARLPTFRDHRIAMAAAILSLGRPRLLIDDPDCVAKSYPGFFTDLDSLCVR